MLLALWVIVVMIGGPLALGIACHVAMRRPSAGAAIAVALVAYAWQRADAPFTLLDVALPFVGRLVAGAFAIAGGFVALACVVGSVRDRQVERTWPAARHVR